MLGNVLLLSATPHWSFSSRGAVCIRCSMLGNMLGNRSDIGRLFPAFNDTRFFLWKSVPSGCVVYSKGIHLPSQEAKPNIKTMQMLLFFRVMAHTWCIYSNTEETGTTRLFPSRFHFYIPASLDRWVFSGCFRVCSLMPTLAQTESWSTGRSRMWERSMGLYMGP